MAPADCGQEVALSSENRRSGNSKRGMRLSEAGNPPPFYVGGELLEGSGAFFREGLIFLQKVSVCLGVARDGFFVVAKASENVLDQPLV